MEGRQPEQLGSKGRKTLHTERWGAVPSAAELRGMGREGCWDPQPGAGLAAGSHVAWSHCDSLLCSCRIPVPARGNRRRSAIHEKSRLQLQFRFGTQLGILWHFNCRQDRLSSEETDSWQEMSSGYTVWRGLRPCITWQITWRPNMRAKTRPGRKELLPF